MTTRSREPRPEGIDLIILGSDTLRPPRKGRGEASATVEPDRELLRQDTRRGPAEGQPGSEVLILLADLGIEELAQDLRVTRTKAIVRLSEGIEGERHRTIPRMRDREGVVGIGSIEVDGDLLAWCQVEGQPHPAPPLTPPPHPPPPPPPPPPH